MRIQKSYGIACYRKRWNKLNYEFLFINKRLSYAFISFIKGMYEKNINSPNISKLLNQMTVDEKIILKSLDFNIIWYKYYIEKSDTNQKTINMYNRFKKKFDNNFMKDGGKHLLYLIEKSTSVNLIWEIPKGHKNNKEFEINAAIREFYEETSISKYKYKILFDIKPIVYSFIDENVQYIYTYYIAKLIDNYYRPHVKLNLKSVIGETADIKLLSIDEMRLLVNDKILISEIKKLIKILKNY